MPLWCQILLARIQGGMTLDEARQLPGSKVSPQSISNAEAQVPGFKSALDLARVGLHTIGPNALRELARGRATPIVDRMASMAAGEMPSILPRDQIGAGRLVLEVAQVVGQGAQSAGPGASVVNIQIVTVDPAQVRARLLAQEQAPGP